MTSRLGCGGRYRITPRSPNHRARGGSRVAAQPLVARQDAGGSVRAVEIEGLDSFGFGMCVGGKEAAGYRVPSWLERG